MKIPYCTCDQQSKEIFSTGLLIFGFTWRTALSAAIVTFSVLEPFRLIPLVVLALLWTLWGWQKFEFKRQALFLGHDEKCAKRYSALAASAAFQGYNPEYGKLRGYKSAIKTTAEQLLGKKRAKKTHRRLTALGWAALAIVITLLTYDGLTRQRNGLPNEYAKYSPGISEAMWSAVILPMLALLIYLRLQKKIQNKTLLVATISVGTALVWLTFVYAVSWYARMDFWTNVGGSIFLLAVVAGVVSAVVVLDNYWRGRKKRHRRS